MQHPQRLTRLLDRDIIRERHRHTSNNLQAEEISARVGGGEEDGAEEGFAICASLVYVDVFVGQNWIVVRVSRGSRGWEGGGLGRGTYLDVFAGSW